MRKLSRRISPDEVAREAIKSGVESGLKKDYIGPEIGEFINANDVTILKNFEYV